MSGVASTSGLISGMDWSTLIDQLIQIDSQPITRIQQQIASLRAQKTAIGKVRTSLSTLRNRVQDFRLSNTFGAYQSTTSDDTVLTTSVSSSNPVVGSFAIHVNKLASATSAQSSARMGSAINSSAALNSSGMATDISSGTFTINGVEFTVDPDTDSLDNVLAQITASSAGVTATYDAGTDKIVVHNTTASDTSLINFGGSEDESNILSALGLSGATQYTNGSGSTETVSSKRLGSIAPSDNLQDVNFSAGAVTSGVFSINGIAISVDPTTDALSDVISRINESDAGVTASYDATNDTILMVSSTLGSRTIRFGAPTDTSNFLAITHLNTATQTAGSDAEFTVNGGATQTRNSNEITDAVSGVTLKLLSTGDSTVTVSSDDDSIVEDVQAFITAFNESVTLLNDITGTDGDLAGDSTVREIQSYLFSNIFNQIGGASGDYSSLADIGITTGDDFSTDKLMQLELDTDKFRDALRSSRTNVEQLFTNSAENGIADVFNDYLLSATSATGFLNARSKSNGTIDMQIQNLNDRIDNMQARLDKKKDRLTKQFINMETMMSNYQRSSSALSSMGSF